MHKQEKGLTLIEVMIAVTVVGVLAVVAIPNYRAYMATSESSRCLDFITPSRMTADAIIVANNGSADSIGTDITNLELTANPRECDGGVTVNGIASGAVTITGTVITSLGTNTMTWSRAPAGGVWQCTSSAAARAAGFTPATCP